MFNAIFLQSQAIVRLPAVEEMSQPVSALLAEGVWQIQIIGDEVEPI